MNDKRWPGWVQDCVGMNKSRNWNVKKRISGKARFLESMNEGGLFCPDDYCLQVL